MGKIKSVIFNAKGYFPLPLKLNGVASVSYSRWDIYTTKRLWPYLLDMESRN